LGDGDLYIHEAPRAVWRSVEAHFRRQRGGSKVVRKLIELGIRVAADGRFYVGDVEISDSALAKAVGVDRRVVRRVGTQIVRNQELRTIFSNLRPVGPSLVDVASAFGYSVLTVEADPHKAGILSAVSTALSKAGILIRQAIADDPDLHPQPKLTLVVDGKIPGEVISELYRNPDIKSVTVSK
jgi:predicted regulator of amino acid metabolism with ACT domain